MLVCACCDSERGWTLYASCVLYVFGALWGILSVSQFSFYPSTVPFQRRFVKGL